MFFLVMVLSVVAICAGHVVRDYIPPGVLWEADFFPFQFSSAVLLFLTPFLLILTMLSIHSIIRDRWDFKENDTESAVDSNTHVKMDTIEEVPEIFVVPPHK